MKDDRLTEMRVFLAVVEAGSFTAAAQAIGASQPFVSQCLQRLEDRLGAKLLHRTTRGHRLTAEGEAFRTAARRAVDAVDLAEAEVQQSDTQVGGPLRVSAPIAFGLDRVTPLIPGFLDRYPGVSLDLRLTDERENLIDGGIDVAIRMGHLPDSALMHRRLCGLQRIVVAAPSLVARAGTPAGPQDLADYPCLAWDGGRDHLNRWRFTVDGAEVVHRARSRFQSNQGMSLYAMCVAGVGAMRMAEHLARPAIARGELVELLADHRAHDDASVFAVFLPDRHMVPRLRVFIDFMVEAFRAPDWED